MKTRLYIVDEYEPVRFALADRLNRSDNLKVVGHAADCDLALNEILELKPDLVLIEVKRKDGMGLELTRQIASLDWSPHLVVLTSYQKSWEELAAVRAGAVTYLLKELNSEELIRKIEALVTN